MAGDVGTTSPVDSGMPRNVNIPSGITNDGLLSDTSAAYLCFTNQRFSNKLQAFMIGYCNSIYSNYSVYK